MAILSTSKKRFKLLPLTLFTLSPFVLILSSDQGALTGGCVYAELYQNILIKITKFSNKRTPPNWDILKFEQNKQLLLFGAKLIWHFISIPGGKTKYFKTNIFEPVCRQTDIIKLSFILMSSIKKWDLHSEIILLMLRVGVVR